MNLLVDVEKAIAKWKPFLNEMKAKDPNFKWIHHDYFDFDYQKYLDYEMRQRIKKEKQNLRKEKLLKLFNNS